ncbi:MAG: glycoside hydrolase family 13 protein [Planctomycetota bacterium]
MRVASVQSGAQAEPQAEATAQDAARSCVPYWAADAVFYQLFPERFRNGDPTNDPTRESLEFPDNVPASWAITRWTSDWYARADWEEQRGDNFFDDGVFDRRYGGDLQGVIDKLPYLDRLGINALYLNPVFYARSLHKYDGNTYHHIDPFFGPEPTGDLAMMADETSDPATWQWTAADRLFLELVEQAHARGIRVVVDGVFNHTGRDFFAFEDLRRRQAESPYRDWYLVQSFDDPATPDNEFKYKGWWGVPTLPEFADNDAGDDLHPGPKQYIFDATRRWMDPDGDGDPADGIDGWRLDVAAEVPVGFWKSWNAHCRAINPECYTVAEHWDDAAGFLAGGGFSATMNYHGFAFPVKGFLVDGTMSASDAGKELATRMAEFPQARQYALQNLIDSHDTDRVASMIVNAPNDRPYLQPQRSDYDVNERVSPRYWDGYAVRKPNERERRVQRLVALMQAAFVGPPMIYYGTEAGMWGGDDPCDRMPMVWPDLHHDPQRSDPLGRDRPADAVAFDHDLFAFYQALFKLRHDCPALRRGRFEVVVSDDLAAVLTFKRVGEGETCYVILNRGDKAIEVSLTVGEPEVREVFTASGDSSEVRLERDGCNASVRVPALDGVVLRQEASKP